jgi:predicted enzyme related to lactoylglutathione lyase
VIESERIDFIGVPVRDRERSAKFYGETLGLEKNPNSSERWIEFETGNVTLALVPIEYTGGEFQPLPGAAVAIRVKDVAAARERLEKAGVEFKGDIIDSGVCHIAPFTDPDGNGLMLHRRYAPYADGTQP